MLRPLVLLVALTTAACTTSVEPDVIPVDVTCVIYQLPDGTIFDACEGGVTVVGD